MAQVELKKKGSQLGSELNVMGVAYAEYGSVSARFSETLQVTLDKDKEKNFRKANIGYRNYFKLRPGKYRLKLVTSDTANSLGSAEHSLDVPAMPESGIGGSSLVIAEEVSRLPDLIRDLHAKMLDDSEPLIFSGVRISPSIENKLSTDSPLHVFFRLYGIGSRRNPILKARLVGENGSTFSLPPIPFDSDIVSRIGEEAMVGLNLPFKEVSPGKYTLVVAVETADAGSPQSVAVQTDLEFVPK
jgi:hypothetical protein